jgi:Transposase DDE domain
MERELWPLIYARLRRAGRSFEQKYVHIQPWRIAAVLLWAALHDRPVSWACDPRNWTTTRLRPKTLPSAATVSRRAKTVAFALFLNRVTAEFKGTEPPARELLVDGKPLPVGRCSKDRDAKAGKLGRGYKLHALWGTAPVPEAWEVTAMRDYEGAVAVRLFAQVRGSGFVYADGNYEAVPVYEGAARSGYQLLARPHPGANGLGHHRQSAHRDAALRLFADGIGWELYRWRTAIERAFGNAGAFGGGLAPLPNWVRTRDRVTRWVWCKLTINAARIIHNRL